MKMINVDFLNMTGAQKYQFMISAIVPRPIAWVSTINLDGITNLAPFSFFNAVSSDPPTLLICVTRKPDGSKKDTEANIELTKEFVVNASTEELIEDMNDSAAGYAYGISEFDQLGIESVPSSLVKPPRVKNAVVALECRLHKTMQIGSEKIGASMIIVGQIVAAHVREDLFKNSEVDFSAYHPLSRLGGPLYGVGTKSIEYPRAQVKKRTKN